MYTFLLPLQINNNNKIKRNNTENTTKTCPYIFFLEKQGILNIGLKDKTELFFRKKIVLYVSDIVVS